MSILPDRLPANYEIITLAAGKSLVTVDKKTEELYVRNGVNLEKTADWGKTFSTVYTFSAAIVRADVLEDNSILVITYDGNVWKSADAGATFTNVLTMAGTLHETFGLDSYDKFVLIGDYKGEPKVYLSNDYGESFNVILEITDASHPHDVKYDPYEGLIWTTWGDHRPNDKVIFSDDLGKTWEQIPDNLYLRSTSIIPLPDCVLFGTDESGTIGTYKLPRRAIGTFQTKVEPKLNWAARKNSLEAGAYTWASKPAIKYGNRDNAAAYWGYYMASGNGVLPARIYATQGDLTYTLWSQDKLADGTAGNGILATWITDNNNVVADLGSQYEHEGVITHRHILKIELD